MFLFRSFLWLITRSFGAILSDYIVSTGLLDWWLHQVTNWALKFLSFGCWDLMDFFGQMLEFVVGVDRISNYVTLRI